MQKQVPDRRVGAVHDGWDRVGTAHKERKSLLRIAITRRLRLSVAQRENCDSEFAKCENRADGCLINPGMGN